MWKINRKEKRSIRFFPIEIRIFFGIIVQYNVFDDDDDGANKVDIYWIEQALPQQTKK